MRGQVTEVFRIYDAQNKELLIPVYQRNYDWKSKHCEQLLRDLIDLAQSGRPKHFFGAVVGKTEGSWRWVVIDGQQRLTTVSLLMLALADLITAGSIESSDPSLGTKIRNSYLLNDAASQQPRVKLKPVKDDADAYRRLFGPASEYIESSNVTANYRYFLSRIPQLGLTADQVWASINKLEVMHLDLEEHDDPQRIFESLNSTGLELSEADKIRNLVLMGLPSATQNLLYEDYWNRMEKNVNYDTDAFLRWYLITKTSKTPKLDQVFDSFKKFIVNDERDIQAIMSEIRDYSDYYKRILSAKTGSAMVDERLRRLALLRQDVTLPFFMPLMAEYQNGTVTEADFADSVRIVESYLFRRWVYGLATNALNKIFALLYKDVRKLRKPNDKFSDVLAYLLTRRSGSGWFPTDEDFQADFRTRDMYRVQSERRKYIFECLENQDSNDTRDIAAGIESGKLSIEHIMPQTLTEDWRSDLGEEADAIHDEWAHRIANLTVTGYNSEYSNSNFAVKKTRPNGFNFSPYRLNSLLKESDTWGLDQLNARSEILTKTALEYWSYPFSKFEPPHVPVPVEPMGTDTDFTNQNVIGFEFEGTKATVANWRDLLLYVLKALVEKDREKMFSFARTNDAFVEAAASPTDPTSLREIVPGLKVSTHSSTGVKVALLRKIFDFMDLDPEELFITLRSTKNDAAHAQEEVELESEFSEITKFIDQLEPLTDTESSIEDTADLRHEIREALEKFRVSEWNKLLGTKPATFAKNDENIGAASADQILRFAAQSSSRKQNSTVKPFTISSWMAL
ncbi:DUF262 domain-containing protein [Glutamicibacter sp. M10]|uniref:DUF262 domain-containing protein n=1 Tax=Glutamicibacter sp. M10 TaxID=3023076 RepID=UPI0021CA51FB|nr:DUF262 domain-containing protein [Glutamicibacter sp. M10]UXN33377.1 DUF262 domain-containing protein [Glutamicibacter sp. M10]